MESFKGELTIGSVTDPACPRHGAIVAVRACGVCRSDLHAWKGADPDMRLPHVLGHEMAGEVREAGPDCRRFSVYARQLSLHGMRGLSAAGFKPLLELIDSGKFDPGRLVSKHISLSSINQVLPKLDRFQTAGVTVVNDFAG